MAAVIDDVKKCAQKCIEKHFENQKNQINAPHQLLFDDNIISNADKDLQKQLRFLQENCVANEKTDFTKPLNYLMQFINSNQVTNLYVLFITDGQDGNA